MKNTKIFLGTIVAIIVLGGGAAFAGSLPTEKERLIEFHRELEKDRQADYKELEKKYLAVKESCMNQMADFDGQMDKAHQEATAFRNTISALGGDLSKSVDFTQPQN